MYQRSTSALLRFLKVPHEPTPPHGDPASLRVFRAGRNHLNLKLLGWGVTQLIAFAGIVFWVTVFIDVEATLDARRQTQTARPALTVDSLAKEAEAAGRKAAASQKGKGWHRVRALGWYGGLKQFLVGIMSNVPARAWPILWVLKIIGILAYFAQLPVTYLVARMDYELRWYMVTDRSLRIRYGVWKISESTMSFANIQQVIVSQGPLQRLLGLADVKVQSAGGGHGAEDHPNGGSGEDMHLGLFHSVTNASEIRDLILERLKRFRESGLGDPDERPAPNAALGIATHATHAAPADVLNAARELLAEATALRASLR